MMIPTLPTGNRTHHSNHSRGNKKKGFTLLEVLIAVSILAFGISHIFVILFGSTSAVKHVQNRMAANLVIENQIWKMKDHVGTSIISDEYVDKKTLRGDDTLELKVITRVSRLREFTNLYRLDVAASWTEGRRAVTLNRLLYIRGGSSFVE